MAEPESPKRFGLPRAVLACLALGLTLAAGFGAGLAYARWTPAAASDAPAAPAETPPHEFALLSEIRGLI